MSHPEEDIAILRNRLPGLIAVYRFGSIASGTARPDSDMDLAILCDQPLNIATRIDLVGQLAVLFGGPVDLIDLSLVSTVMRAQIVTTGERLYCADARKCDTFEDFVFSSYAGLNEEGREILRDIKLRESVYG
ncbi:MAG: nucleotidyltransferase domain-containing protein [Burkholderiales bacterium]